MAVDFLPMLDTTVDLDPQVILDIEDPFDRFEAAARAVESAQQLISDLQRIKAHAVASAVAVTGSEREVAKRTGLTQPNVHIYVKADRLGISPNKARYAKVDR